MLASTLLLTPSAPAQATGSGDALVDLYLASSGLTPDAPTGTTSASKTVTPIVSTPALTLGNPAVVAFGTWTVTHDFNVTSDAVLTAWVTADNTALLTDLRALVYKGSAEVARGQIGTFADTSTSSPLATNIVTSTEAFKVEIGIPLRGTSWVTGDSFGLRFSVFGLAATGTPADIKVLFGSTQHPSRIGLGVSDAGALPGRGVIKGLFLADRALVDAAPTAATDIKRVSGSKGQANLGPDSAATATTWGWGEWTAPTDLTLVDDATLTFWVNLEGSAVAWRGIGGYLNVAGTNLTAAVGVAANAAQSKVTQAAYAAPVRYLLAFNTAGIEVPAGATIRLSFVTWSTSHDAAGNLVFLFGSAARPAVVTLRAAGVPGAPVSSSTDTESATNSTTLASTPTSPSGTGSGAASTSKSRAASATNDDESGQKEDVREPGPIPAPAGLFAALAIGSVAVILARRRR